MTVSSPPRHADPYPEQSRLSRVLLAGGEDAGADSALLPERPLSPRRLHKLLRHSASQLATRHLPLAPPAQGRRFFLLGANPHAELWLIQWSSRSQLALHDHWRSNGAFLVLEGELLERNVKDGSFTNQVHGPGDVVAFGSTYIHDVSNAGAEPAVSIHAYSPPLRGMTFYDVSEAGTVIPVGWHDRQSPSWHP